MSTEAQEPGHWPFTNDAGPADPPASFREALARKNARASAQTLYREQHARLNRLIVGGRAHKRQHGLS